MEGEYTMILLGLAGTDGGLSWSTERRLVLQIGFECIVGKPESNIRCSFWVEAKCIYTSI